MAQSETLSRGTILPSLQLPDPSGREVRTGDYRGRRNLVLYLSHPPGCDRCEAMLHDLAAGYGGLVAAGAEVLAILPASSAAAAELKVRLGLPFPLLTDASGTTVRRLGGGAAVIIVDRFGEIFRLERAGEEHQVMGVLEIAEWLDFIEVQCPE